LALFIALLIIFDDGGANERSLPLVEFPLNCIWAAILWPLALAPFLNHGDPTGAAILLLLIVSILLWGFINDFFAGLRKSKQRMRPYKVSR
jgi:hypothetical protein